MLPVYRLYKRRFVGLAGFVILNIISAMSGPWFGPISNETASQFGITLNQVNWLGNIMSCIYMPATILIPIVVSRHGIRRCCDIGAVALTLSAWIRYAGIVPSLPINGAYALLFVGQALAAITQAIFQVLGPSYSETWFDLKGRTTATMIIAISNPIGAALGQLISPLTRTTRESILVLGVISTLGTPFVFLIGKAPPTPPTYAGSRKTPSLLTLLRAWAGLQVPPAAYMSPREQFDFTIVVVIFGVLAAAVSAFVTLTGQILNPAGYSSLTSGIMGATLLLTGIVSAIITAPLFDRVFTRHLAVTAKVLVPVVGGCWLGMIWAVKPNNTAALYALMALIGGCSITMLPIGLELVCELTRNADGSSAVVWFVGNLFTVVFILAEGALRAPPTSHPPLHMRKALIFNGVFVLATSCSVVLIRGRQARREMDEEKAREGERVGGGGVMELGGA